MVAQIQHIWERHTKGELRTIGCNLVLHPLSKTRQFSLLPANRSARVGGLSLFSLLNAPNSELPVVAGLVAGAGAVK